MYLFIYWFIFFPTAPESTARLRLCLCPPSFPARHLPSGLTEPPAKRLLSCLGPLNRRAGRNWRSHRGNRKWQERKKREKRSVQYTPYSCALLFKPFYQKPLIGLTCHWNIPGHLWKNVFDVPFVPSIIPLPYIQFSCTPTTLSRCVLVGSEAKTSSPRRRSLWSLLVLL